MSGTSPSLALLRAAQIAAEDRYLHAYNAWYAKRFAPWDEQRPLEIAMHETREAFHRATAAVEKAEHPERVEFYPDRAPERRWHGD